MSAGSENNEKRKFYMEFVFHMVELEGMVNGDIITDFKPGFAGSIIKTCCVVGGDPVVTGAKLSTVTPYIGALAVVGGVLTLNSANMTPMGKVIEGSTVKGSNNFTKDDVISWVASATTDFIEGDASLRILVEGKVL